MILYPIVHLERETDEAIKDNIGKVSRREITEEEGEERHEIIMKHYKAETERILSGIPNPHDTNVTTSSTGI